MKSVRKLMDLSGRVALVTGGAGFIGTAISEAMAELGASVVVLDIVEVACAERAGWISDRYSTEVMPLVVDLADEKELRAVPVQVLERFQRLDIVFNCAGLVGASELKGWAVPFMEQHSTTYRKALDVNLTAPFVLVQSCAEALKASGHGSVINIASIYGLVGPDLRLYEGTSMGNPAGYAASKGGLIQLTRWLATVLAPHVRVNAITPGGIWRNQPETFREQYVARTPLGRMGTEENLKGAAAYLASDLSAYVTGQNLIVDGGWPAW